jgi:hypothetical protein
MRPQFSASSEDASSHNAEKQDYRTSLSRRFYLREEVYACKLKRHWIILNTDRDQYYCMPSREIDSMAPMLYGWPESLTSSNTAYEQALALAEELAGKGLLTEKREIGRPFGAQEKIDCSSELNTSILAPSHTRIAKHLFSFFRACVSADRKLTHYAFMSTLDSIRKKRPGSVISIERIQYFVAIFNSLRLWYPRPYLCLFDSLALIEFLSIYQIRPTWVFGVTADPFQAHCWVQHELTVLNDNLWRIRPYTPIMLVRAEG